MRAIQTEETGQEEMADQLGPLDDEGLPWPGEPEEPKALA
jgi:hypothetical protein